MEGTGLNAEGKGPAVLTVDGERVEATGCRVEVQSPLWRSGASLFETMLVRREGETGLAFLDDHIARLVRSAGHLGLSGLPGAERLKAWVREAAHRFKESSSGPGRLRLTVAWTRSGAPPVAAVLVVPYGASPGQASAWVTPVRLAWGLSFPMPKWGNRLLYDLAEREARRSGADEGLLVDARGAALEGARSNLFLVREDALVTPPLESGALPGIARGKVIELAKEAGLAVREEAIDISRLQPGDELFLTNALWGVRPVAALNGRSRPVGPVSLLLKERYEQLLNSSLE